MKRRIIIAHGVGPNVKAPTRPSDEDSVAVLPITRNRRLLRSWLCVNADATRVRPAGLVAFVEGFDWANAGADAVVKFDARRFPAGEIAPDALRSAVEDCIRAGRLWGAIAPGYHVIANA